MEQKTLRCLQRALCQDRALYRTCRTRVILAEGRLVDALRDWQQEKDWEFRETARLYAQHLAQETRKHRRRLAGVAACVRLTQEQYREASRMMEIV